MNNQVIIVEDCLIQSTVLKKILENEDFEVVDTCKSGSEAIDKCRQKKPALVLMDIYLDGDLDGFEVAKKIRETNEIPFVFITAIKNSDELLQNYNFDHAVLLSKPVSRMDLLDAISLLMDPVHAV